MTEKTYVLTFSRIELTWLMRQLEAGKDRADGIIKTFSGEAISNAKLSDEQRQQLEEANAHRATLENLITEMKASLAEGEKYRLAIYNQKMDLEEVVELAEEESAKEEARKRIAALPNQEGYRIQFDRATVKFTLRLIENDLQKFRAHIIPQYEKAKPEDFQDPLMPKSFWVNKVRRSKETLEQLKTKLEKKL